MFLVCEAGESEFGFKVAILERTDFVQRCCVQGAKTKKRRVNFGVIDLVSTVAPRLGLLEVLRPHCQKSKHKL